MTLLRKIKNHLSSERGVGVVEINSGNSSTNENFKEMLKNLVFSMILGFC